MENVKKNKIILHCSLFILIINIIIIYGIFFESYITKDKTITYTSFPWYANVLSTSFILSVPQFILEVIYLNFYKKLYSKYPSILYRIASAILTLALVLGAIECFVGKIPFCFISLLFLIVMIFYIILLIKAVFYKLLKKIL